jgi:hypothetical protein
MMAQAQWPNSGFGSDKRDYRNHAWPANPPVALVPVANGRIAPRENAMDARKRLHFQREDAPLNPLELSVSFLFA